MKGSKNASLEMTSFMDGPARYMEAGRLVFFMSKSGAPPPPGARCHNQAASARRRARRCYIGHTCGGYRSYIHTEELRRTNSQILAKDFVLVVPSDCAQFNIKYTCKPIVCTVAPPSCVPVYTTYPYYTALLSACASAVIFKRPFLTTIHLYYQHCQCAYTKFFLNS